MSKLKDYIFSAPDKIYTEPMQPKMLRFYRVVFWVWVIIYITHISTWSILSIDQLSYFSSLGFFVEIEIMLLDDSINSYAAAHAELLVLMLPYFFLNTLLIIVMLLDRLKILTLHNGNLKHRFPLMFFGVLFLYLLEQKLLFSGSLIFFVDYNTNLAQLPIWLVSFLKTIIFPLNVIVISELIWNPKSRIISKF
ncbi:hypothetical protein F9L33_03525 [Amylibacter sp. SFDW26]|uniref:hypothetical protein n=1 Tax=Amylibacter sp. SFDW26 TaxID=2652722 RepID=UPI0012624485|nr:hypothetical protein [Amylibacter sp. SFDW26]KAB7615842.1 hypothetical protein F9L33_03525 [Amylibacter sp. SFDW26]